MSNLFKTALIINFLIQVKAKDQYVAPLNMGMKVSTSYDIANLVSRFPIRGGIAVGLSCCLLAIIFFGIITSPFGYFFGIPSKKYVLGNMQFADAMPAAASRMDFMIDSAPNNFSVLHLAPAPRSFVEESDSRWGRFLGDVFNFHEKEERSSKMGILDIIWKSYLNMVSKMDDQKEKVYSPTILDSMFSFMPNSGGVRSKGCDLLTICYSHGALKRLPSWFIKIYKVFSAKLSFMPPEFKKAVIHGVKDYENCLEHYGVACSETPFNIVLQSYLRFLPKEALLSGHKRKQEMYM